MIQKEGHVGAKVKENECENMLKKTRLFYLGKAQISCYWDCRDASRYR